MWEYVFGALPYLTALILAAYSLGGRILRSRYEGYAHKNRIRFAERWAGISDVITLPILTLVVAVSRIGGRSLTDPLGVDTLLTVVVIFVAVLIALFIVAMWSVARDLREQWNPTGPTVAKVAGIVVAYLVDLGVTQL